MTFHRSTREAANGMWRGILMNLGVPGECLVNRHGPCPLCGGGNDRFRFDNREGSGTWICSKCGAGDGFQLAERFLGMGFAEVARRIDGIIGNEKLERDRPAPQISDDDRMAALRRVAASTRRVEAGDLVDAYLTSRGLGDDHYPRTLRFAPSLSDGAGGVRPCMVATVQAPDGENVTLHRTFLRPDGLAKAEMEAPRKLMPGGVPDGAAVRLGDWTGGPLGVAEGIETALSAARLYELPVWSCIATSILAKWEPPEGCREVVIFGDTDPKFGGQAAAFTLAKRLASREGNRAIEVTVKLPATPGQDWNDVLMARLGSGVAA